MSFEETELRLGLPGNGRSSSTGGGSEGEMTKKRGFHETMTTMADLKLNLISSSSSSKLLKQASSYGILDSNDKPSPPKAQVVGWPPIRSHRKNSLALLQIKGAKIEEEQIKNNNNNNYSAGGGGGGGGRFVKVSLDGAPYLRKLDLTIFNTYNQLSHALAKLFAPFTIIGNCGSEAAGMKDLMNESKLIDLLNTSDYVPTYQDKDGDWMLVGDVPWQMFVESCKRLRVMKGKEAIGLAPRTVEKCKNYKN